MLATLHHIEHETPNIATFYFATPRPLRYVAGQFIEMTLPHVSPDERGIKRWFTLSSAPGHELISVTTKHAEKSSTFKAQLWNLKPGETVDISEPMGDFVLPKDPNTSLVFIAGGVGITPFHSIIQWLVDTGQTRSIQLVYSVHSHDDLLFGALLAHDFIQVITRVDQPQLTAKDIDKLVGGFDDKQLFISGPEPMTESIVKQLTEDYGITQDKLITDYFPGYPI